MSKPRTRRAPAIGLLLMLALAMLAAIPVPVHAQNVYCPAGDGGPEPPAAGAKAHLDLTIGDVHVSAVPATGNETRAEKRGAYHVLDEGGGTINVTVAVDEVGGATADGTVSLRATLGNPDGSTVLRTANVDVPSANANTTHKFLFPAQTGRHTIFFQVNPGQSPAEECTDGVPNSACPEGGADGCTQTYYSNNQRSVGVLAGGFPDLHVTGIGAQGPTRATAEAQEDSEVTFDISVTNRGQTTAFNLSSLNPGATPMTAWVEVDGCDCPRQGLDLDQIGIGATKTFTTDPFAVHGLTTEFDLKVVLDPLDWVPETDEADNELNETFPLPTPELSATTNLDLPMEGDAFVIPKGRSLNFDANIVNDGLGPAQAANGSTFRVAAHVDGDTENPLFERNLTLEGLGTAVIPVTIAADNLSGSHTVTISVDADDDVFESDESDNEHQVEFLVAEYGAIVSVKAADRETTVPPGVSGRIPFAIQNTGTVTDTFDLRAPAEERNRQRYIDADGEEVTEITLGPKDGFNGEVEFDIPSAVAEGDQFNTTIIAVSRTVKTAHEADVTYVVGPDTVAPTITLDQPASGFLSGDTIVVRITDNVAVETAEAKFGEEFVTIQPTTPGGSLYTLNTTGQASPFSFQVRATDAVGNEGTETFELVRDTTAPSITSTRFTPPTGSPGEPINLVVSVNDDNIDTVVAEIFQERPDGQDYEETIPLTRTTGDFILRDWVVPARGGYYRFNVTATDLAGNEATEALTYRVPGLNLRIASDQPIVSNREPVEGERLRFLYVIENTSPTFRSGPFFVVFILDNTRQIGLRTLDLAPGESVPVQFEWVVTPGPHDWALVIDQANEVYEDDESIADNVMQFPSSVLFPDYALFAEDTSLLEPDSFGERLGQYWYVPTLLLAVVVLFTIAFVLGRRPTA